jgi:hypothetical protein
VESIRQQAEQGIIDATADAVPPFGLDDDEILSPAEREPLERVRRTEHSRPA